MKLIYPNPYLEDYSCNNLDVEINKDYLKLTPQNFRQPPEKYWISFAINKGFEPEDFLKKSYIILKGIFDEYVTLKIDKQDPIQLSKEDNKYRIPIKGNNIKAITIGGELDQSIIIDRLSIEESTYKIPKEKKKIYFIMKPMYPEGGYFRKGERDILDHLDIVDKVDDDTLVYVRPVDEMVTKGDFENITKELDEIKTNTKAKIINDIQYFYNYKIKNFAFDIWQKNNIPYPEYQIINSIEDLQSFINKYERCVLRINEGWGARNSYAINKETNLDSIYKNLIQYKSEHLESKYEHIDIIINRKILPVKYAENSILNLGRCFVVNNEILNIHSFVHRMHNDDQLTGSVASNEDFIEAHKRVLDIQYNYKDLLLNAVHSLGLQVGCLDFLIENNKPICLEVNAFWGMGMGAISYPYSNSLKQYLLDNYKTLKDIVPNIYERMDQYNLWKRFYKLL